MYISLNRYRQATSAYTSRLYLLKAMKVKSLEIIQKIRQKKDLLEKMIIKVKNKLPKLYKKELVELFFEQSYSKIEFVVEYLKVEWKAASRHLKQLESIEILEAKKVGREILYINKELINILRDQNTKA